jgi:hypothetical protein
VNRVLHDLRVPNKCHHAYALIEIGGRLQRRGFSVSFEPKLSDGNFPFRPDALVDFLSTSERLFLELSCQGLASRQLSAFEAMDACHQPIRRHFEKLKCSFSLRAIPAPNHMEDIVRRIECSVQAVLATGHLAEVIEDGTLEMGICDRDNSLELDGWRKAHGFHFEGYEGPWNDTNEIDRLKQKIAHKQSQLPAGHPNMLLIENNYIFSHYPNILRLISALQEEVHKHKDLAFVLVQGSNASGRDDVPGVITQGEHRFERHVRQGHVHHTLLLSNRYAASKPSDKLVELLMRAVFD